MNLNLIKNSTMRNYYYWNYLIKKNCLNSNCWSWKNSDYLSYYLSLRKMKTIDLNSNLNYSMTKIVNLNWMMSYYYLIMMTRSYSNLKKTNCWNWMMICY